MKKSLQALIFGSSLLLFSCHKDLSQNSNEEKITSERGEEVGGSSGGVWVDCKSCVMAYPDNSKLPMSAAAFNENDVLVAFDPCVSTCGTTPDYIKVWYSDEHPICIGARQVVVKEKVGSQTVTTTKNFDITPSTGNYSSSVSNPLVGATDQSGDFTGNDPAVGGGRPLWPALYITDLTEGGDIMSRKGDWQQGGQAIAPDQISGMWKAVVRTVDKTKNPALVTITVDSDPSKSNGWNLAGDDTPPAGTASDKFGAVVKWDVKKLINNGTLKQGHMYRLQFMVHDGDQNKTGGDVGEACTTIFIPGMDVHQPD